MILHGRLDGAFPREHVGRDRCCLGIRISRGRSKSHPQAADEHRQSPPPGRWKRWITSHAPLLRLDPAGAEFTAYPVTSTRFTRKLYGLYRIARPTETGEIHSAQAG